MRRRHAIWLLPWLCACHAAAPAPVQVPKELERYADACAFVPNGMQSFALVDARWFPRADGTPHRGLLVFAVRANQVDPLLPTGVTVHDAGADGDPRQLLSEREVDRPTKAEPIAGNPCFFVATASDLQFPRHHWFTIVDNRFVVRASRPQLLAQALQRTGTLTRILQPCTPPPPLGTNVVCMAWNLAPSDQETQSPTTPPVADSGSPIVSVILGDPWRMRILAQHPLSKYFADRGLADERYVPYESGAWNGVEVDFESAKPMPRDWMEFMIRFSRLFSMPPIVF